MHRAKMILRKSAWWSDRLEQIADDDELLRVVEELRPARCWGPL